MATSRFRVALAIVDSAFPRYDANNRLTDKWEQCEEVLPRVKNILSWSRALSNVDVATKLKLGKLFERASWYLQERGNLSEAEGFIAATIQLAKDGMAGNEPSDNIATELRQLLSDALNSLGALHMRFRHFSAALKSFDEAIELADQCHRRPSLELFQTLKNSSLAYLALTKPIEAHIRITLAFCELDRFLSRAENPGKYLDSVGSALGVLARVFTVLGKYDDAWQTAIWSTEIAAHLYGAFHVSLSDCYIALGRLAVWRGQLRHGQWLFLNALKMRLEHYDDHEATAVALHHYARTLMLRGEEEKGIYYQRACVSMLARRPDVNRELAMGALSDLVEYQGHFSAEEERELFDDELVCCFH